MTRYLDTTRRMSGELAERVARRAQRPPIAALLAIGLGACAVEPASVMTAAPPDPGTHAASLDTSVPTTELPATTITPAFDWRVVVDNLVTVPGDARPFNSYNQPSVNVRGLVAFRARSRGGEGGEPAHGVYLRDMSIESPIVTLFDRMTEVPQPNNLCTTFVEPPSFPRIDIASDTVASRGNHPPVWEYLLNTLDTRAGTTGVYTNPFGPLITGASGLGNVPDFGFFAVPGTSIKFDVFPGAPAITDRATLVFKGNFTEGLVGKTGVYYRNLSDAPIPTSNDPDGLAPAGGARPAHVIADVTTRIPGSRKLFGSTAPPSAAWRLAVFAGFDVEEAPTRGGIYLAPLFGDRPPLLPLVQIGGPVPGETGATFNRLGEGVSFDGRFVAFWGAWGTDTFSLTLPCPTEGNKDRVAYCQATYPNGFTVAVPVHQGIFVHDVWAAKTRAIAKAPVDFDDFVYWNFSGMVPGTGESDDAGEPARWRASSFVAVSGLVDGSITDSAFHAAFKARKGAVVDGAWIDPIDGIYLRKGPGAAPFAVVVETGMDGTKLDPGAVVVSELNGETLPLPVTEMGLERDGFRGDRLVVNVSMGTEEAGFAGIYLTSVPADAR